MSSSGKSPRRPGRRLSHRDLDALMASLPELYAHAPLAALPKKVLTIASRLVPSKVITFDKWDVDAAGRATAYSGLQEPFGWDVERFVPVLAVHIRDHPLVPEVMQKHAQGPVKITDYVTKNQFLRTGIYNEVYQNFGIDAQMILTLAWQERARIYLVLNRNGQDFSERDRQMLTLMLPHLKQAYANAVAWDDTSRYERLFLDGRFGEEREIPSCKRTAGQNQSLRAAPGGSKNIFRIVPIGIRCPNLCAAGSAGRHRPINRAICRSACRTGFGAEQQG